MTRVAKGGLGMGKERLHKDRVSVQYLTVQEMADELRVSEQTVRNWCADGRLTGAVYIGKAGRKRRRVAPEHWQRFKDSLPGAAVALPARTAPPWRGTPIVKRLRFGETGSRGRAIPNLLGR